MSDNPFIPKSNSKIVPPFIPKPKESLEAENARLKAEVERLRKWMDDISLDTEGRLDSGLNVGWTLLKIKQEYNAAKEGKPLAGQEGWWGVVPPPQEGEVQS